MIDRSRGTKEYRKGQHWLGLQELLTCCLEPIKGLCTGIGPIRRLDASIWSMLNFFLVNVFLSKKRFPKIGIPKRILGVPLEPLSLLSMQRYTPNVVLRCTL